MFTDKKPLQDIQKILANNPESEKSQAQLSSLFFDFVDLGIQKTPAYAQTISVIIGQMRHPNRRLSALSLVTARTKMGSVLHNENRDAWLRTVLDSGDVDAQINNLNTEIAKPDSPLKQVAASAMLDILDKVQAPQRFVSHLEYLAVSLKEKDAGIRERAAGICLEVAGLTRDPEETLRATEAALSLARETATRRAALDKLMEAAALQPKLDRRAQVFENAFQQTALHRPDPNLRLDGLISAWTRDIGQMPASAGKLDRASMAAKLLKKAGHANDAAVGAVLSTVADDIALRSRLDALERAIAATDAGTPQNLALHAMLMENVAKADDPGLRLTGAAAAARASLPGSIEEANAVAAWQLALDGVGAGYGFLQHNAAKHAKKHALKGSQLHRAANDAVRRIEGTDDATLRDFIRNFAAPEAKRPTVPRPYL